jgi:hypothetical protein
MPETKFDSTGSRRCARPPNERLDDRRAGTPCHVEPGNRVAMSCRERAAALCPSDYREKANSLRVQPRPLFTGRKIHVRLGPTTRPFVFGAVESGSAEPVSPRQVA